MQRYHVVGDEGPICLVHSGGPGIHWEYLKLPQLEGQLRLVHVEPIGTGQSGRIPDGDYSVARYARFAHGVVEHLGEQQVYFLGHSHGAFVGLQYALDYPKDLAGLILYEGSPAYGIPEFNSEMMGNIKIYEETHLDDPAAGPAISSMLNDDVHDDASFAAKLSAILPLYFANWGKIDVTTWQASLGATHDPNRKPSTWDVRALLGTVHTPTLVLVGRHDFICGPRWANELVNGISDSTLVVFENSGHFAHVEEPAQFFQAVHDFAR